MIQYLTVDQVLTIHRLVIEETGGDSGILNMGTIESSIAQPAMTFGGADLYESLADKAAILSFSLNRNHGFSDGNKRVAYVALRTFLQLNGHDLSGDQNDKERVFLAVAASEMDQDSFNIWVHEHNVRLLDGNNVK